MSSVTKNSSLWANGQTTFLPAGPTVVTEDMMVNGNQQQHTHSNSGDLSHIEKMVCAVWENDDDDEEEQDDHVVLAPGTATPPSQTLQIRGSGLLSGGGVEQIGGGAVFAPTAGLFHGTPPAQVAPGLSRLGPQQQQPMLNPRGGRSFSKATPTTNTSQTETIYQPAGTAVAEVLEENLGTVRRTPEKIQKLAMVKRHLDGGPSTPPPAPSTDNNSEMDLQYGSVGFTVTSTMDGEEDHTKVSPKPGLGRKTFSSHITTTSAAFATPPSSMMPTGGGGGRHQPMMMDPHSNHMMMAGYRQGHQSNFMTPPVQSPAATARGSNNKVQPPTASELDSTQSSIHTTTPTAIVHAREASWKAQGPKDTKNKFKVFIQNLEPRTSKEDLLQIFFPFGGAEAEVQPFCPPGARRQGLCYFSSELLAVSGAAKLNNFVPHGQTQPLLCAYDDEPWGEAPPPPTASSTNKSEGPPGITPAPSTAATTPHNTSAATVRSSHSSEERERDDAIHSATIAALSSGGGVTGARDRGVSPLGPSGRPTASGRGIHHTTSTPPVSAPLPFRPTGPVGVGGGGGKEMSADAAPFRPPGMSNQEFTALTTTKRDAVPNQQPSSQLAAPGTTFSPVPGVVETDTPAAKLRRMMQKTPGSGLKATLVEDIFQLFVLHVKNPLEITKLTGVMLEHLKYHRLEGMQLLRQLIHKFADGENRHLRSRSLLDPLSRPIVAILLNAEERTERIGAAIVVGDLFESNFIAGSPFNMAHKLLRTQAEGRSSGDPDLIDALVAMTASWATNHTDRVPCHDEEEFNRLLQLYHETVHSQGEEHIEAARQQARDLAEATRPNNKRTAAPETNRALFSTFQSQQHHSEKSSSTVTTTAHNNTSSTILNASSDSVSSSTITPTVGAGGLGPVGRAVVGTLEGASTNQQPPSSLQFSSTAPPLSGGDEPSVQEDSRCVACTVYVTRVPPGASEAKLRAIFIECGEINKVRLYEDKQSRGAFGFVEFNTPDSAQKMIRLNDRRQVDNSRMRCNAARNAIHDSDPRDAIIDQITGARIRDCLFGLSAKPQNVVVRTSRLNGSF